MIWAPKARSVALEFFTQLAARDMVAAEALRERLDGALTQIEAGAPPTMTLVLPDGRVLHRHAIPPLLLTYERGSRGVMVLQVLTSP